jgi:multicomponent Na+:H+ antiporter subunit G
MMAMVMNILACVFLIAGLFFMLVGAIGIVRFPDTYNRLHASSKCGTLGLAGLLIAAVLSLGVTTVGPKALLTIVFAFVAFPVGSHILAKAAHLDKAKQWDKTLSDELAEDRAKSESE